MIGVLLLRGGIRGRRVMGMGRDIKRVIERGMEMVARTVRNDFGFFW